MSLALRNSRAARDLVRVVRESRVWHALAWVDIRSKYRLSSLGSLCITATTGTMAVSIGALYGQFFGKDITEYLPYFTIGFILWTFIAGALSEGSNSLIAYGNLVKGSQVPVVFHVLRVVQKQFLIMLHSAIVVVGIWLYHRWALNSSAFLALIGLALMYVFVASFALTLAIVCVRFRDIPPLVQAFIQFLFFATPIMWDPANLQYGQAILLFNPIAGLLIVSRNPLLGLTVDPSAWLLAGLSALVSVAVASGLYLRYRPRIAYWV